MTHNRLSEAKPPIVREAAIAMIDLHSHILPDMDDGAASFRESFHLARRYEQMGYKKVVATPHVRAGELSDLKAWDVIKAVIRLNAQLHKCGIGLQVLPGMEMELDTCLPEQIKSLTILTLAHGNYVLVETPFLCLPQRWEKLVFELSIQGTRMIFAHPERCAQLAQTPGLADKMVAAGAYLQVNWDSFLGRHGDDAYNVACYMARRGLIHCLATDSHHPGSRDPGMIADAAETVSQIMGEKNLELVSKGNPARVLDRQDLEKMDLNAVPDSPSRLSKWLRRAKPPITSDL